MIDTSTLYLTTLAVLLLIGFVLVGTALLSHVPRHLAPVGDSLSPCGTRPNCVSSLATDPRFHVEALALAHSELTMNQLQAVVAALPRTKIITVTATYLHAVSESPLLRFVDDIELLLRPNAQRVEVRCASRVGHSDLGQNRRRVEAIRARLAVKLP